MTAPIPRAEYVNSFVSVHAELNYPNMKRAEIFPGGNGYKLDGQLTFALPCECKNHLPCGGWQVLEVPDRLARYLYDNAPEALRKAWRDAAGDPPP